MSAQLVAKLNKLAKLANELDAEAKALYGPSGNIFYESGGTFYLMNGDVAEGTPTERQECVKAQSTIYCRLGAGVW